jgi:Holliday junction resolvase RusA-like endonuclease
MWVYGQARLSTDYRRAKEQVAQRAGLWFRRMPLDEPVCVVGRFWFPDRRKRDAGNYRKLLTDALTAVAYVDDALVHDERWTLVAIDRDNPRCELSVSLYRGEQAA